MSVQIKEVETEVGLVELAHPTIDEVPDLVLMLKSEDLDLRRLVHTSNDTYSSKGRDTIEIEWGKLLSRIRIIFSDNLYKTIRIQSEGILSNPTFPEKNVSIKDPFNLATIEKEDIDNLSKSQLQNLNINLLMGTQPTRLKNIFTEDRIANGFASRFLMVESEYIQLNEEADPFTSSRQMCSEWVNLVTTLYEANKVFCEGEVTPIKIEITKEAKDLYRKYYKQNLQSANERIASNLEGHIIGTQAKMSAYIPRLTQLISILNNPLQPVVNEEVVELAQRLFKYYANSTVNIISKIFIEADTGLPSHLEVLFNALPDTFTFKQAEEICKKVNLPEQKFKNSLRRKDFGKLFKKIAHGEYQKAL